MPTEKPRYCITVDDEMLKEIDDFRFGNRYNSRSQATLELIRLGLQALKEQKIMNENSEEGEQPLLSAYLQALIHWVHNSEKGDILWSEWDLLPY